MKMVFVACAVVFLWIAAAKAESVEVYDWAAGTYKEYAVQQNGSNVKVYDREEGSCSDYSISPSGRNVYDWQTGNYLDLRPKGDDRFEVYDWQAHKYYDVRVKHR